MTKTSQNRAESPSGNQSLYANSISGRNNFLERLPPLTSEREAELSKIIQGADSDAALAARDELCRHNYGIVGLIVTQYQARARGPIDADDLFQVGVAALFKSAEKFDARYGVRFQSYAAVSIRHALANEINLNSSPVHVPPNQIRAVQRAYIEANKTYVRTGSWPAIEDVAGSLDANPKFAAAAVRGLMAARDESVFTPEQLPSYGAETVLGNLESRDHIEQMSRALKSLPPKLEAVLRLYSGISADGSIQEPLSTGEGGKALGISRQRFHLLLQEAASELMAGEHAALLREVSRNIKAG